MVINCHYKDAFQLFYFIFDISGSDIFRTRNPLNTKFVGYGLVIHLHKNYILKCYLGYTHYILSTPVTG